MNQEIPPHQENPYTIGTDPIFIFDVKMESLPPGTKARPRPSDRPPPKAGEAGSAVFDVQFLEGVAEPVPPGTMATPRPPGRERWRTLGLDPPTAASEPRPVRKFIALLKDRRTVTVLGTSLRFLTESVSPGNAGVFAVVVEDNQQEQFAAMFQASDLSCIFEGDLSAVNHVPN